MTKTNVLWTVHYFNSRLNRDEVSREFSSEQDAMYKACDLMRKAGMRVDMVKGPKGEQVRHAAIVAWCKAHRTPETPANLKD